MPSRIREEIPEALRHFESLPDSALVRQRVVQGLFAISPATVWRRVHEGALPAPRRHGARTTAWNVGELRAVLTADYSRAASTTGHPTTRTVGGRHESP